MVVLTVHCSLHILSHHHYHLRVDFEIGVQRTVAAQVKSSSKNNGNFLDFLNSHYYIEITNERIYLHSTE